VTFEPRFIRYRYVDSQAFRKSTCLRGFKRPGFNDCAGCTKEEPDHIIVFLIIAAHEIAYGKK
jgi:hypothetical protein